MENLRALGFVRVLADGTPHHLDELPAGLDLTRAGELLVMVDRLVAERGRRRAGWPSRWPPRSRRAKASRWCCIGRGRPVGTSASGSPASPPAARATRRRPRSRPRSSPSTIRAAPAPSATGSARCSSTTSRWSCPIPARSLADGAIDPWTKPRYESRRKMLLDFAPSRSAPIRPSRGTSSRPPTAASCCYGRKGRYVGIFPFLKDLEEKRYKQYIRVFLRQYQLAKTCEACGGSRLNADALAVRIGDDTIAGRVVPLGGRHPGRGWTALALTPFEREVAALIVEQLDARLGFLRDVGLGYLTLDRQTRTLSGGEAQRISLANALGSRLVDTLYVLDEPSVGLHPRDTDRLLAPAPPPARRRQHGRRGRARPRRHPRGRLHARAGPRLRRPAAAGWCTPARSPTARHVAHRPVPHRREADRGAERAPARRAALAPDPRRHPAQPQGRGRRHPARAPSPRSPA